jgi:hypothetical protein
MTSDRWRQSPDVVQTYDSLLRYLVTTETLRRQARAELAALDDRLATSAGTVDSLLGDVELIVQRRNAQHFIEDAETRRQETEPVLQRFLEMHSADPVVFSDEAQRQWALAHLDADMRQVWEHWNINQDLPEG